MLRNKWGFCNRCDTYIHILNVLSYRACLEWILLGLNSFQSALNTYFPNYRAIACLNSILSKCRTFITYPWKVTIWSWEVQIGNLLFRRYGIELFSGLWVLQFPAIHKFSLILCLPVECAVGQYYRCAAPLLPFSYAK